MNDSDDIKKRILAVAPEATFFYLLDEIVIECSPEHAQAALTAAMHNPRVWTKYPKLAVDRDGHEIEWEKL